MATSTTTQATTTCTSTASPKPRIRRIGNGRYLIESRSRPGIGRQVDVHTGQCGCPAGRFGRRCWHRDWAEQFHAWREAQLALGAIRVPAPQAPSMLEPQQTAELVELSSFFE